MALLLIVAGMLFLTTTWAQQDICNYDPDLIFFDNDQLEKLRKSILNGDCSPSSVGWKFLNDDESRSYIENDMETDDLSNEAKETLSDRRGSRVRFPEDRKIRPEIFFGSESHHGPYQHIPSGSDGFHKYSNQGQHNRPYMTPRRFHPGRRLKRQTQSGLFGSQLDIQPRFLEPSNQKSQNNNFIRNLQNQEHSFQRHFQKEIFKDQRGEENGPKRPSLDLFRPNEQVKPQQLPNNDKKQNQKPLLDLFKPDDQNSLQKQRQPNKNRKPSKQKVTPVLRKPQTTTPSAMEATTVPGPPTWPTAPSLCVQRCPNTPEYNPVCGTDRVTYTNPGRLRCEQRCGKADVSVNHYGICGTTQQPSSTTTTPRTIRRITSRNRNVRPNQ